jgi:hypothetical protein
MAWEDQPKREGMKVRGGRSKSLNEHLGPLRRYLAGQVGRPWDKAFADICRYLDRGSAVQDHVRDHLNDFVAVRVIVHNGQLCHGDGYGIGTPLRTPYYVCPRSGILKKNKSRRPKVFFRRLEKLRIYFVRGNEALIRHEGAWCWITWQEMPATTPGRTFALPWDALLKRQLWREESMRIYGRPVHVVSVRRACKREIRQAVNSYPYPNRVR